MSNLNLNGSRISAVELDSDPLKGSPFDAEATLDDPRPSTCP